MNTFSTSSAINKPFVRQLRSDFRPVEVEVELIIVSGEKRNRTAEAIIASNTVSDRRVPKVMRIKMKTRCDHDG